MASKIYGYLDREEQTSEEEPDDFLPCPNMMCEGDETSTEVPPNYLSPKAIDISIFKMTVGLDPNKHAAVMFKLDLELANKDNMLYIDV